MPHCFFNLLHWVQVWLGDRPKLTGKWQGLQFSFLPSKTIKPTAWVLPIHVEFPVTKALCYFKSSLQKHELMLTLQILKLGGRRNLCTYPISKCGFISEMDKEHNFPYSSKELIWALPLTAGCDLRSILRPPYSEEVGPAVYHLRSPKVRQSVCNKRNTCRYLFEESSTSRKSNLDPAITFLRVLGIHWASALHWTQALCLDTPCQGQDVHNNVPI